VTVLARAAPFRFAVFAAAAWALLEPLGLAVRLLPGLQMSLAWAAAAIARTVDAGTGREALFLLNRDGLSTIYVAPECVGLSVIVLFLCAVLARPGVGWARVAVAAITGATVLWLVAAMRIAALHLTAADHPWLFQRLHADLGAAAMLAAAGGLYFALLEPRESAVQKT